MWYVYSVGTFTLPTPSLNNNESVYCNEWLPKIHMVANLSRVNASRDHRLLYEALLRGKYCRDGNGGADKMATADAESICVYVCVRE